MKKFEDLSEAVADGLDACKAAGQAEAELEYEQNKRDHIFNMRVEVTGPDGSPIYASGTLRGNDARSEWDNKLWPVNLVAEEDSCSLSDLRKVEVWIDGSKQSGLNHFIYRQHSNVLLGMVFGSSKSTLWVELGWTSDELDEQNLSFYRSPCNLMDFVCDTLHEADDRKMCNFTHFYIEIQHSLLQSVLGQAGTNTVAPDRRQVLYGFLQQHLGDQHEKVILEPVCDMLMSRGFDVTDRAALTKILGTFFGERFAPGDIPQQSKCCKFPFSSAKFFK